MPPLKKGRILSVWSDLFKAFSAFLLVLHEPLHQITVELFDHSVAHLAAAVVITWTQTTGTQVNARTWGILSIASSSTRTKTKRKTKTKAFVRSCMFWNKSVTNEPIILCNVILRAWFVHHRHYLERTKTFVFSFVFVFVLAHEQAISTNVSVAE